MTLKAPDGGGRSGAGMQWAGTAMSNWGSVLQGNPGCARLGLLGLGLVSLSWILLPGALALFCPEAVLRDGLSLQLKVKPLSQLSLCIRRIPAWQFTSLTFPSGKVEHVFSKIFPSKICLARYFAYFSKEVWSIQLWKIGFYPGWCSSVLALLNRKSQFNSQSAHKPGLWAWSSIEGIQEAANEWFPSLMFCLPSSWNQ